MKSGHWWIVCFGDVPKKCRRPEFGVELYDKCRAPGHGAESYLPCVHRDFGIEKYLSCRNEKHGIEKHKKCYTPIDKSMPKELCSQDQKDYQ